MFYICIQIFIHFNLITVKFQFRRIQKSLCTCKTRNNMVYCLYEINNINHCTIWHCCCNIASNRIRQCRFYIGLCKFLLPCSLSVKNITITLYHNLTGPKHICKFSDFFSIFNRLVKWLSKIMRT